MAKFTGTFWLVLDGCGWAMAQLWLFWLAPLLGGALAGVLYRKVLQREPVDPSVTGQPEPGFGLGART